MKLIEKIKKYIAGTVREELKDLEDRESRLEENVRNLNATTAGYEKLEENVRNLNAMTAGYEALAENVRNLNAATAEYEALAENVRNLNAATAGYEKLAENVRNLNAAAAGYEEIAENVRNLNRMLQNFEGVIENIKNNNAIIEILESEMEMYKVKLAVFEKSKSKREDERIDTNNNIRSEKKDENLGQVENVYSGIDYFDFENHFRGPMKMIKENQRQYVKYYLGKSNVVDLGCGRGEFLELLSESGIISKGVDTYEEFVQMCQMKGLDVVCDDALHFLDAQQTVGGIFAGQLIEHLPMNQLVELCKLAYEKLEEDSYIVMETPNPTCLAIYSQSFYMDPSHNKPIHPLTIKYILEKSGFNDIEIIYTDTSRLPVCIPPINGVEEAEQFNNAMHTVSEMLFGSQDYAIIAKKHTIEVEG